MFGLPIVLAAFALMGAQPQVTIDCDPAATTDGLTTLVGSVQSGWTTTRVDFGHRACAGLVYLSSPAAMQDRLRQLNPRVNFLWFSGIAMVAVLHEAHHATGDGDEARTECLAMKAIPLFVRQHARQSQVAAVIAYAREYDSDLSATYHGATC